MAKHVTLSVPGPTATERNTELSTVALNGPRPDFPITAPAANPVFYRT